MPIGLATLNKTLNNKFREKNQEIKIPKKSYILEEKSNIYK